jgi:hypothetical protein
MMLKASLAFTFRKAAVTCASLLVHRPCVSCIERKAEEEAIVCEPEQNSSARQLN